MNHKEALQRYQLGHLEVGLRTCTACFSSSNAAFSSASFWRACCSSSRSVCAAAISVSSSDCTLATPPWNSCTAADKLVVGCPLLW